MSTRPGVAVRWDVVTQKQQERGIENAQQLAAAMGVDPSTVSRVMAGKAEPGPRFMSHLCAALDMPLAALFNVEDVAA